MNLSRSTAVGTATSTMCLTAVQQMPRFLLCVYVFGHNLLENSVEYVCECALRRESTREKRAAIKIKASIVVGRGEKSVVSDERIRVKARVGEGE